MGRSRLRADQRADNAPQNVHPPGAKCRPVRPSRKQRDNFPASRRIDGGSVNPQRVRQRSGHDAVAGPESDDTSRPNSDGNKRGEGARPGRLHPKASPDARRSPPGKRSARIPSGHDSQTQESIRYPRPGELRKFDRLPPAPFASLRADRPVPPSRRMRAASPPVRQRGRAIRSFLQLGIGGAPGSERRHSCRRAFTGSERPISPSA